MNYYRESSLNNEIPTGIIDAFDYEQSTQISFISNYSIDNVTTAIRPTIRATATESAASSNDSCLTNRYINVTCELPTDYAIPLYGYIMPFLLIITIIANTLIVVVLSKRHMRTPTNIVLMAMALCDMFTLLFPAPWLIYMYTFGNHYKPLWPISTCYAWSVMHEVSNLIFLLLSSLKLFRLEYFSRVLCYTH